MKIAILTRSLPVHRTGGLETATWDLARFLSLQGCRVFILTTAHPKGLPEETRDGVTILYTPGTSPARYTPLFFSRLSRRIRLLHEREKLDIVHSEGFAGLTFSSPPDLPLVATLHGTLFSETPLYREQFQTFSPFEKLAAIWRYRWRIAIRPLYRRFLKRLDRIFVDSRFSLGETLRDVPGSRDKFRVVPLGIDVSHPPPLDRMAARKRLDLPLDRPVVFTLSRLEKMKGIDTALEAARALENRDFLYLIGGEGRSRSRLEKKAKDLGLSTVRFPGRIPDNRLSDYFTAADLFLYPEISQPAFGLVSLEAMFHGCPVLGSDAGAIPEVVTPDKGWLFKRGDAADLAAKWERILNRIPELREKSEHLRRYVVEHFSLERFIGQTLEVYREVLEKR